MYDRRLLTELELSVRSEKNKRQRRLDRMTTEIESVEINFSLLEATCTWFTTYQRYTYIKLSERIILSNRRRTQVRVG